MDVSPQPLQYPYYLSTIPTTSPACGVALVADMLPEVIFEEPALDPLLIAELALNEDQEEYTPDYELIGDWTQNEDTGEFDPTPGLPQRGFAAICHWPDQVVQVVASKWVSKGRFCSPCYPGQVDLHSAGEYLGYELPPRFYGENRPNTNPIEEIV